MSSALEVWNGIKGTFLFESCAANTKKGTITGSWWYRIGSQLDDALIYRSKKDSGTFFRRPRDKSLPTCVLLLPSPPTCCRPGKSTARMFQPSKICSRRHGKGSLGQYWEVQYRTGNAGLGRAVVPFGENRGRNKKPEPSSIRFHI